MITHSRVFVIRCVAISSILPCFCGLLLFSFSQFRILFCVVCRCLPLLACFEGSSFTYAPLGWLAGWLAVWSSACAILKDAPKTGSKVSTFVMVQACQNVLTTPSPLLSTICKIVLCHMIYYTHLSYNKKDI